LASQSEDRGEAGLMSGLPKSLIWLQATASPPNEKARANARAFRV